MVEWDKLESFDRYPKVSDELKNVDEFMQVIFQDDGRDVPAETIQKALQQSGQKNIKARDSIVFHVKQDTESLADFEVWLSSTAYSNLRELKEIRTKNGDTLKDAKVKIQRISKDDMTKASFKFEGI